jgi:hypothetical protein
MNEVTVRFLQAIAEQVGAARVTELRLFPPLRQGAAETGVAVVAALPAEGEQMELPARHTLYSARYRLLVKGPDRGRWEVAVVPQADAPLLTVDEVVRGVMRRTGEEIEPERIAGGAFRSIVSGEPRLEPVNGE